MVRIALIHETFHLLVENVLHLRELDLWVLRVLHDLGIMTCVSNHADNPLCVFEHRASQNELVVV